MESIGLVLATLAVLVGTFFSIVGVLGMLRLPDAYSRLHATGKVGVFGVVLLLVAAVLWTPLGWGRALLLIILIMIWGPVTTHAITSAAHRIGLRMVQPIEDDLEAAEKKHASLE